MKILVEIDLKNIEPNDVYKPNSSWFVKSGYITIPYEYLPDRHSGDKFDFKYLGQIHEHNDIPRP